MGAMQRLAAFLKRHKVAAFAGVLAGVAFVYVLNERRHVVLHDMGMRWSADRAACFPYTQVISGKGQYFCSDSMAVCEEQRTSTAGDHDYESVGSCRVMSRAQPDLDAYSRDVVIAWVLGGLFLLALSNPITGLYGDASDRAWRRKLGRRW